MSNDPKPPTTENQLADEINTAIDNLSNLGISVVEGMMIADQPWLGFPGIKQAWELLFGWVAGYFIRAAQNGVTFAVIDAQVGHEESNMSTALANLVAAEKTGDPDAIHQAILDYASAQSALTRDDGSSLH
ncbi:MAG TPA: hypothetical protein VIJ46_02360 [Rhabdochlamydiaceae bacterium]